METRIDTSHAPRWTVDAFRSFWANPDPARIPGVRHVIAHDIVGHWPRSIGQVHGAEAYVKVIAAVVRCDPRIRLEVAKAASSDDSTFVHWVGTVGLGGSARRFHGCDHLRMKNGLVVENYVFCEDPWFERVAGAL